MVEQTPFIARRAELQLLAEEFADVRRLRRGGVLVLHGARGVGASRLASALSDELSRRSLQHRVLEGRCSRTAPIAFGPFVGVLRDLPGGADGWLADAAAVVAWNPDHAAATLLAGVLRRLATAAEEQPLLVVLDDIDAADPSTLQLVEGLGPLLADLPILLLCAGRTAANGGAPLVGTTPRGEVVVPAMTDDELGDLFDALEGVEPASRSQVVDLAAGRPGTLVALARAVRLEQGLAMLLATIGEHADRAVAVAAVAPGCFDAQVLPGVAGCTREEVERLVETGALHLDGGGLAAAEPWGQAARHSLGHAWQTLTAGVAAAIPAAAPASLRAAAWEAAGAPAAAAREYELAANEAYQRHAVATAAALLRRAVVLGGDDALLRWGRRAAEWSLSAGHRVAACDLATALLPLVPRADDDTLVALHVLRHHALFELDDPGADAALDAALAIGGASAAAANAMEVDVHRLLVHDRAGAAARAADAVRCADAARDPSARAAALGVQALVEGFLGHFDAALRLFEQAMLQAETVGAIGVESRVSSNRLYVLWLAGRPADLEREAMLELGRRLSRGLESVADHVAVMRGIALTQLGRQAEARAALQEALLLNGSAGVRATAQLTVASLDVIDGRLGDARATVRAVAGRNVAGLQEVATEIALCNHVLAAAEGRWAAAAEIAQEGLLVAAVHEVSRARMLLAQARASVLAGLPLPADPRTPPVGRELEAIAAEMEALRTGAVADHAGAVAAWLRLPAPVEAWRCRFVAATRARDLSALEVLGNEAAALGAAGLEAQAKAAWRDAGGRRNPRRAGAVLTDREADVLRLVADGLTNKQIAARLHLSPRTVGVHLEHCFGKLEVGTRSAAVQEAMRRGVLRPPT